MKASASSAVQAGAISMDATALRWALGVIGIIFIAGIYLYSVYQSKLRRQAMLSTFTREEMEAGFIEDEALRQELSNINSMLNDDVQADDISSIKLNPTIDLAAELSVPAKNVPKKVVIELPSSVNSLLPAHRVAHILKSVDNRLLTAKEIDNALTHAGFTLDDDNHYRMKDRAQVQFTVYNLTANGSFQGVTSEQFSTHGVVCCIDLKKCSLPVKCYDALLKKIDELVRVLDLKVYNDDLELLTLQHVTDIRGKLVAIKSSERVIGSEQQ